MRASPSVAATLTGIAGMLAGLSLGIFMGTRSSDAGAARGGKSGADDRRAALMARLGDDRGAAGLGADPDGGADAEADGERLPRVRSRAEVERRLAEAFSVAVVAERARALYELIEVTDAALQPSIIAALERLPRGKLRVELLALAISRYAAADPEKATTLALALPASSMRNTAICDMLDVWTEVDSDAAASWTLSLTEKPLRSEALARVVGALASFDPQGAMTLLRDSDMTAAELVPIVDALYTAWAPAEPERAAQALATLPLAARSVAAQQVVAAWGEADPEAALRWLLHVDPATLPDDDAVRAADALLERLADTDAARAAQLVPDIFAQQRFKTGYVRDMATYYIGFHWAQQSPQGALAWVDSLPREEREQAREGVITGAAATQPELGAALAVAQYQENDRDRLIAVAAEGWATKDPRAAAAWALALPESSARAQAFLQIAPAWVDSDLEGATAALAELRGGEERDALLMAVGNKWAEQDPERGLAWVSGLSGEEHDAALGALFERLSWRDGPKAAQLVGTLRPDAVSGAVVDTVAGRWSEYDPAAAASWWLTNRKGDGEDGVRAIVSSFRSVDEQQAIAWSNALPRGSTRDVALDALIGDMAPGQAAWDLALSINDEDSRRWALASLAGRWAESDPEGAPSVLRELAARAGLEEEIGNVLTSTEERDEPWPEDVRLGDGGSMRCSCRCCECRGAGDESETSVDEEGGEEEGGEEEGAVVGQAQVGEEEVGTASLSLGAIE